MVAPCHRHGSVLARPLKMACASGVTSTPTFAASSSAACAVLRFYSNNGIAFAWQNTILMPNLSLRRTSHLRSILDDCATHAGYLTVPGGMLLAVKGIMYSFQSSRSDRGRSSPLQHAPRGPCSAAGRCTAACRCCSCPAPPQTPTASTGSILREAASMAAVPATRRKG